jgi:exopolyphosphatase/guanosine-5'-triphosphate,3'-diphosphate pyrophosphatase
VTILTEERRVRNGRGPHAGTGAKGTLAQRSFPDNCRLLVASVSVVGFDVIDAYSRPVRLGEGMVLNGTLCGDRMLEALDVCPAKIPRLILHI